jgi:hypothetical protein
LFAKLVIASGFYCIFLRKISETYWAFGLGRGKRLASCHIDEEPVIRITEVPESISDIVWRQIEVFAQEFTPFFQFLV